MRGRSSGAGGLGQVQRDELGLVGSSEDGTGEIATQENTGAAERDSHRQRDRTHNDAQKNSVDQQVRDVVLLVEIRVLIPRDAGLVVHRTQKHLCVALRKRAGCDRDDRARALIKKRANIFDSLHSSLRLRCVIGGVNAAQMLTGQCGGLLVD